MGLMGVLKAFTRVVRNGANISDVKADTGGGRITTAENFSPAGEDSHPVLSDVPFMVEAPGTGRYVVLGYLDPVNEGQAAEGEKRFLARDASGTPVSYVWLKNDGSLELNGADDYAVAYTDLKEAFDTLRDELNAFISVFNGHVHSYLPGPGSPTPTDAPATSGTDAEADMSPARVSTVRLP